MKWNKYTLTTTTEAVDMISYTLGELGIEGIEIQDKVPLSEEDKKKMFVDILPQLEPDDGIAYVSFYIEPENDTDETISSVLDAVHELKDFVDIGEATIVKTQTADVDWMNNWREYWKPFQVDDKIWIKPTWETLEDVDEDALVVELDPGSAFGTGMHHTTRLCIKQIKKYLRPEHKLFDVGCGSGILSIVGLLLGCDSAAAVDVDEYAVKATLENAEVNHIDMSKYVVETGNIITNETFRKSMGEHQFDIVAANILAEIIVPLTSVIKDNMKPGGLFITSGILDTKAEDVRTALVANGFEVLEMTQSGDWVSFTARG